MATAALLFDFDGTLIDTETPTFNVWREVYRAHGLELPVELWRGIIGSDGFDPFDRLQRLLGFAVPSISLEEVEALVHESCSREALRPGIASLLREGSDLGLGLAVASSSSRNWVEAWLIEHEIRHFFRAVICREDVAAVKPAPDLYLRAAVRLRTPPSECIAIEDSPNGANAARSAGIWCVAAPSTLLRGSIFPEGTWVVDSLAGNSLGEILARREFARAGTIVNSA